VVRFILSGPVRFPKLVATVSCLKTFLCIIFLGELLIKHAGLGFRSYWSSPFDAFDGVVVTVSTIFLFLPGGAIAGLFRIGRVFRLIKRAPKLRALMTSMVMVVPAISNVFAVLLLLLFVFAAIGVQLFGKVRYGFTINQDNNFKTTSMAMITLWRLALNSWRATMYDTQVAAPMCTENYRQGVFDEQGVEIDYFIVNDCGSPAVGMIFAFVFQILATFAVLNVVIAIILSAFTWCYSLEQGELTSGLLVNSAHLRHFKAIWDKFDLFSSGKIDTARFRLLLAVLQWNIHVMFETGAANQNDEDIITDYCSFGGPRGIAGGTTLAEEEEGEAREQRCKDNYEALIRRIGRFERSQELWQQLDAAGCDILMGCNDNVAGFVTALHPLGSSKDADLHIFTKEVKNESISVPTFDVAGAPPSITIHHIRFSTLIQILCMDALHLDKHDQFVCHGYKDPFSYFQPGYFKDKTPVDGVLSLNEDPASIEPPDEGAGRGSFFDLEATALYLGLDDGPAPINTTEGEPEGGFQDVMGRLCGQGNEALEQRLVDAKRRIEQLEKELAIARSRRREDE